MITWLTPIEITPSTADSWEDVDVSSYVPSGASGIIIHIRNSSYTNHVVGFRKNGSTDDRKYGTTQGRWHFWTGVGIDGSRIVELYVDDTADIDIYLVGYMKDDEVFFTNAPDKSLGSTGSWVDIDISSDTGSDTAIGAFFEVVNLNASTYSWGVRKNGSSDSRVTAILSHSAAVIGVDGSEICEGQVSHLDVDFFLLGYIKANSTFNTNATDISLDTVDAWLDLDALPTGATGGFIEAITTSYTARGGLRKNGSSENIVEGFTYKHAWGMVECDGSRIIEGYITSTYNDFFLVGYPESGGGITEWLAGVSAGVATVSGIAKVLKEIAGLSAGAGMVIDVGAAAIDRAIWLADDTIVSKENPAKATGKINHIEIYMNQAASVVVEVASFFVVSGNNLSTRASSGNLTVQTGFNEFDAPGDFTEFDIKQGDYIGLYVSSGKIEFDISGGVGVWYLFGDYIPCENQTFNLHATHTISLYVRVAGVSGLLKVAKTLTGTVSGVAIVSGEIIVGFFLAGVANGIATVNGIVKISKTIKGTASGIATVVGILWSPGYKELFIKRVRYRISSQGIRCDLELGELYLPLEQEILNILRDLKNERELLQANTKQLSV